MVDNGATVVNVTVEHRCTASSQGRCTCQTGTMSSSL